MRKLMSECLPARSLELLDQVARLGGERHVPVYVVGGFVRDLMLGAGNLDIDVVVEGNGLRFARELAARLGAGTTPHPRFGTTVLTFPDGSHLDVATARRETYRQPGALPDVKPGTIAEDMARRDFSINSLAIRLSVPEPLKPDEKDRAPVGNPGLSEPHCPSGEEWELIDLNGGVRDLQNKTIRILHDDSFVDDPTRIFRAVRFEQRLGFTMEKNTQEKLKQALRDQRVDRLSGHRVFNELIAILEEPDCLNSLRRMAALEIFQAVERGWKLEEPHFQVLENLSRLDEDPVLKQVADQQDTLRTMLLGLLWPLAEALFHKVLGRLDPPGKLRVELTRDRQQVLKILEGLARQPAVTDVELYRLMDGVSPESACWSAVAAGDERKAGLVRRFFSVLRPRGKVSLTGQDLIRLGLKPGPRFQEVFEALLQARLEGRVGSREEEETLVREMFPDPDRIRN
ncbi:MAG: CCA tRNA nucleotidyltransferase [Nitrospina sp.]|nr:CCA tRNA nucleotidyltransferase [Nitrospina sp.]